MKKNVLLLVLIAGLSFFVKAQDKVTVGILPLTFDQSKASTADVNSIQDEITNSFVKTKRFNIVDRTKMDKVKQEKELQKSEDFMDGSTVEQGKSLGAQFLISGNVNSAQAERMTSSDGKSTTYKATLSISLQVIDISTGQIIATETIEPKSGNSMLGSIGVGSSSPEQCISKAIQGISDKIDAFVQNNFPITFSISEIQKKDNNGAATEILITGGSAFGLKKGESFKVIELVDADLNGKKVTRKKEVGQIKINKVEDENFSDCDVKSGGSDITTKFEAKAKLQVISETP